MNWLFDRESSVALGMNTDPLLHQTLRIQLPGLAELSDADIVRIRTDDEVFAWWKAILSKYLVATSDESQASRLLWNEVQYEVAHFRSEMARHSVPKVFRNGSKDFAVGTLSSIAASAAFGQLSVGAAAGVVGLASRSVANALMGRSHGSVRRAKLAHVALLKD